MNNERGTTTHVLWHCPKYDDVRQPYLDKIRVVIDEASREAGANYDQLQRLVDIPCFKNSGLCPGDINIYRARNSIPTADPLANDPHAQRQLQRDISEDYDNIKHNKASDQNCPKYCVVKDGDD